MPRLCDVHAQVHSTACFSRDVHEEARKALKDAHLGSSQCQICHAVVSYVRAALANDETKKEIELVRAPPTATLQVKSMWRCKCMSSASMC